VKLNAIRLLVLVPAALSKDRVDAVVAAASDGDMLHVVVLHCDEAYSQLRPGFCRCVGTSGDLGCSAAVTDLIEEVRSSNVLVAFNPADARHMMWAGPEAAIVLLDGVDASASSSSSSNSLLLLQLHRYARDRSFALLVQSAAPSFSDVQMLDAAVRTARNFGRGVAFCGVKCGTPMKPQLWTPISYVFDNRKWINDVHDPYEKALGWG
jgi:hypothetical protein